MTTAIDLFAGLGGWSTGARAAGVKFSGRQITGRPPWNGIAQTTLTPSTFARTCIRLAGTKYQLMTCFWRRHAARGTALRAGRPMGTHSMTRRDLQPGPLSQPWSFTGRNSASLKTYPSLRTGRCIRLGCRPSRPWAIRSRRMSLIALIWVCRNTASVCSWCSRAARRR